MAESINGVQVAWGVNPGIKEFSETLITGIIQNATSTRSGNVTEIQNEDGDHVTRVDHGEKNEISVTLLTTTDPVVLPSKGTEIDFGLTTVIDGIDVTVGRAFNEDASATQSGSAATEVTYTISHYPAMVADAP